MTHPSKKNTTTAVTTVATAMPAICAPLSRPGVRVNDAVAEADAKGGTDDGEVG